MDALPPPPPPPPPRSFAHRIIREHFVDVLLLTDLLFDTWLRDDDATSIAFACMDRSAVQLVYLRLRVHTALMLEQVLVQWPRAVAAMGVPDNVLRIARDTLEHLHKDEKNEDDENDDDNNDGDDDDDRPSKRARTDDATTPNHRIHPTSTVLNFHQYHEHALDQFDSNDVREHHLEVLSCTRVWHPSPPAPPPASDTLQDQPQLPTPTVASLDAFLAAPLPLFRTVYCVDPRVYTNIPPALLSRIADARFAAALASQDSPYREHATARHVQVEYEKYDRKRSASDHHIPYELDADDLVDYRLLRMLAPLTAVARPRQLPAGTTFVYVDRAFMNEQLQPGELPTTVRHLVFAPESSYNRPFELGTLPSSLVRLVFLARAEYDQPFALGVLPLTLQRLSFNGAYRQAFGVNVFPNSLRELEFRWSSRAGSRTIADAPSLPDSLELLGFHRFGMIETAASLCRLFPSTTPQDEPLVRDDVLESGASHGDVHQTQLQLTGEGNGGGSPSLRCDVAFGSYTDASQLPAAPIALADAITIFVEGIIAQVSADMAPLQPLTAQQLTDLRAHLRSAAFVEDMWNAHARLQAAMKGDPDPRDKSRVRLTFEGTFLQVLSNAVGNFRLLGGTQRASMMGVPDMLPEPFVRDAQLPAQLSTNHPVHHFITGRFDTPAQAPPETRARGRVQSMIQMILQGLVVRAHNVARGGHAARPVVRGYFTDTNEFRFAEFYGAATATAPSAPSAPSQASAYRVAFSEVLTWDYNIGDFDPEDPQHWLNSNARITAFFVADLVRAVFVKAWVKPKHD